MRGNPWVKNDSDLERGESRSTQDQIKSGSELSLGGCMGAWRSRGVEGLLGVYDVLVMG